MFVTIDDIWRGFFVVFLAPKGIPLVLGAFGALLAYDRSGTHLAIFRSPALLVLGALAVVSICIFLNHLLSDGALNNWCSDTYNWSEELVLVTGGSNGIGAECVRQFGAHDVRVAVLDIAVPTYVLPSNCRFFKCDITDTEALAKCGNVIRKQMGHPTVLINNAGTVRNVSILDASRRDIDLTYDLNTKAHYFVVKEFLPHMVEHNHGHVVTTASITAYVQAPRSVAYCSSKAATLSFHEGLGLELLHTYKAPKIRTSLLCPGHVETALFSGFEAPFGQFLSPSLMPRDVAKMVVGVVLSGRSQIIIEPLYGRLLPIGRSLPSWAYQLSLSLGRNSMAKVQPGGVTDESRK